MHFIIILLKKFHTCPELGSSELIHIVYDLHMSLLEMNDCGFRDIAVWTIGLAQQPSTQLCPRTMNAKIKDIWNVFTQEQFLRKNDIDI